MEFILDPDNHCMAMGFYYLPDGPQQCDFDPLWAGIGALIYVMVLTAFIMLIDKWQREEFKTKYIDK